MTRDGRHPTSWRVRLAGLAVVIGSLVGVGALVTTNPGWLDGEKRWVDGRGREGRWGERHWSGGRGSGDKGATAAWLGSARLGTERGAVRLEARLGKDQADVYLPETISGGPRAKALPVALLLQGANVDKQHYSTFAALLAREGFVVVVPNHWRTFPPLPLLGRRLLLADQRQIADNLGALRQLNASAPPPWRGVLDTSRLVVVGHSMGGLAGIEALANRCRFPLCIGRFARPTELRGGVVGSWCSFSVQQAA